MLKNIIKRFFGVGSGLFRSPRKATELMDEQIFLTMQSIGGTFKENSLIKEIEAERLKISREQEEFIKKYEKGEISDAIADLTIDKISQKYKELEIKVDELNGVREDIKAFDSKGNQKEKEFYKEMQKHKTRTLTEFEKGY